VLQLGFTTADPDRRTETFPAAGRCASRSRSCCRAAQPAPADEPTNHLVPRRNWLETFLVACIHAVILVSHDRFFLDAVVTRIADLTLRTLTDYHTNYSDTCSSITSDRRCAAKHEQDEEVARVRIPSTASATRRPRRRRCRADQDAREGRADRGAARAQEDPPQLSRLREERPDAMERSTSARYAISPPSKT
jgi:ATPase subunit of ABC transporter with duplicated ATPase domains